jgi:hypothetical protein
MRATPPGNNTFFYSCALRAMHHQLCLSLFHEVAQHKAQRRTSYFGKRSVFSLILNQSLASADLDLSSDFNHIALPQPP